MSSEYSNCESGDQLFSEDIIPKGASETCYDNFIVWSNLIKIKRNGVFSLWKTLKHRFYSIAVLKGWNVYCDIITLHKNLSL